MELPKVFLVYECSRGRDVLRSIWSTIEAADRECKRLLSANPNSDGYYTETEDVRSE